MGFQAGGFVADDNAYQQALRRRGEILAELQKLQGELRDVDEFVSLYGRLFPDSSAPVTASGDEFVVGRPLKRQRNILPPARLAEICREIIIAQGRPMTRSELLVAIEARGIPLAGNDPSKNLGTILWRRGDLFENLPGRGYWVKGVELPKST